MKTLDAVVVEAPIFAGLEPAHAELIAGCAQNVRFRAGQFLFREGGEADTFYLLRHGTVSLETFVPSRGSFSIETIDESDVVGWSWLFPPYRWHFDARALEDVAAVAFDGVCLRGKATNDHELGYVLLGRFARVLADRLDATRLRLLDVYGAPAAR
jgi:CRP/FNR family cyclic AMP-dependent transcriptional regulator